MRTIVVQAFITLDGVIQAPGGSDEDTSGGFGHGGWSLDFDAKHGNPDDDQIVAAWESRTEALLLGRRTYEIFAGSWGVWNEDADGFEGELTRRYNRIPKFVASHTLGEISWKNSHLLGEDVPGAVEKLDVANGGEIRVWGSSVLIRTLAEHDLVDEYRLLVYPIVLGSGKRLFPEGFPTTTFELAESRALRSGVVLSTYRRAG